MAGELLDDTRTDFICTKTGHEQETKKTTIEKGEKILIYETLLLPTTKSGEY